jgi:SAM-dependent methyltransferase
MFPKSSNGEKLHRKHKREMEVSLSVDFIQNLQKNKQCKQNLRDINILEFGCGDGFQVPYLKKIGTVVASDVYRGELKDINDVQFVECDITNTPFESSFFDIIYSNHVIEHVENLEEAFDELFRIGDDKCIYAFSVPTNIWLLLSLPAQYLSKIKTFLDRIRGKKATPSDYGSSGPITNLNVVKYKHSLLDKLLTLLGPSGHGVTENYFQCYKNFRIQSWHTLFFDAGFSVVETKPLLLYGPSEWPLIPTLKSKFGLSSSVLFLMMKKPYSNI